MGKHECCTDFMCRVAGIRILLSIHLLTQVLLTPFQLEENTPLQEYGDKL